MWFTCIQFNRLLFLGLCLCSSYLKRNPRMSSALHKKHLFASRSPIHCTEDGKQLCRHQMILTELIIIHYLNIFFFFWYPWQVNRFPQNVQSISLLCISLFAEHHALLKLYCRKCRRKLNVNTPHSTVLFCKPILFACLSVMHRHCSPWCLKDIKHKTD